MNRILRVAYRFLLLYAVVTFITFVGLSTLAGMLEATQHIAMLRTVDWYELSLVATMVLLVLGRLTTWVISAFKKVST